jgi:hypothetical protein
MDLTISPLTAEWRPPLEHLCGKAGASSLGPMREARILPGKCRSFFLELRGLATQA